jgi:YesN/AraC family two-component response regulator
VNVDILTLKNYMSSEKPFLDPAVTIQDSSRAINIPVRELSVLINQQLGRHFDDFVNTYRIETAMQNLKDPSNPK